MRKINILTKSVYNRIAAGEVVDRPYSAVKELIENSLDAGATSIDIYIERGGKQFIKVVDNGSGIERDDMRAAFLPHATSKIATADDLDNILTLGFRGEALASISAVAKIDIISVTQGNGAYRVRCEGGNVSDVFPAALEKGTEITVCDLFYNTPVRAKFMKSDKNEETDITNFVSRYILGYPNVAFKYFVDGKLKLQSFGGGLEEAIAQVYGAKTLSQCFRIQAERHGIKLNGFISNQNFFKPNKTYQSLFLNGRYIVNSTISTAVSNAYASYAMKRQYPFYVLFVEVPAEDVDVNVHPNKADVRFTDSRAVFGAVYSTVSAVLDGTAFAADFVLNADKVPEIRSTMDEKSANKVYSLSDFAKIGADGYKCEAAEPDEKSVDKPPEKSSADGELVKELSGDNEIGDGAGKPLNGGAGPTAEKIFESETAMSDASAGGDEKELDKFMPYKPEYRPEHLNKDLPQETGGGRIIRPAINTRQVTLDEKTRNYFDQIGAVNATKFFSADSEPITMAVTDDYVSPDPFKTAVYEVDGEKFATRQQQLSYETYKYRGCLFNTYLVYEHCTDIYFIDQHAAHERLIFDSLMERLEKRNLAVQPLLLPFVFETNPIESSFLCENLKVLLQMGFGIAPVGGGAFRINSVPTMLTSIDLRKFVDEILADVGSLKEIKLKNVLRDKIATTACKHAVKGGMELSQQEIDSLFNKLKDNLGLKCPHGRPVCVRLTKTQIEKMFKRIV